MRDELRHLTSLYREKAIIKMGTTRGRGTHWCAFRKIGNGVSYFDPLGSLPPPQELPRYWVDAIQSSTLSELFHQENRTFVHALSQKKVVNHGLYREHDGQHFGVEAYFPTTNSA